MRSGWDVSGAGGPREESPPALPGDDGPRLVPQLTAARVPPLQNLAGAAWRFQEPDVGDAGEIGGRRVVGSGMQREGPQRRRSRFP